ncbi:lipid-A-disaccharide synthase N-terminal domain-containing protein [Neochlamydia sp. AcF95]|uniref:lipid-A-disaccharide synthase N-terminal domain-containing protein n=1 Tax=Neochlamydia sp. AcF95 TaxID=2795734 RepID=UPI001BCA1550|nr:lipid-A-disaccharide synthase N-terminal domain-containing protein [Neochlamydia sp. AcF95]MBS4170694.1 Uncharacterized protein [Neochlamydia sp. AcF95]
MSEQWREIFYPLGFIASLAFGARFIIQWLRSEICRKSVVTPLFWKLSLMGNLLLLVHSFIQMQFHVGIVQVINAVISWRNLNLMKESSQRPPLAKVIEIMLSLLVLTTLTFYFQQLYLAENNSAWLRLPSHAWSSNSLLIHPSWHIVGFIGLLLFNCRFWIQWWQLEKTHTSQLSAPFWWISLLGAFFSIVYFIRIYDPVNMIGPTLGIVPYIRNLMLLSKNPRNEKRVGA